MPTTLSLTTATVHTEVLATHLKTTRCRFHFLHLEISAGHRFGAKNKDPDPITSRVDGKQCISILELLLIG